MHYNVSFIHLSSYTRSIYGITNKVHTNEFQKAPKITQSRRLKKKKTG